MNEQCPSLELSWGVVVGVFFAVLRVEIIFFSLPVGVATRYGLGDPGIESQWGTRFSAPVQTGHGAHPASCTMGTAAGAWC